MDNLERLIRNNATKLNNEMPPDGHFDRFEMRLAKKNNVRRPTYWIGFLSGIAAVLVIGIFFFFTQKKQETTQFSLSTLSEQYAEVEYFYTSTINNQSKKLDEITKQSGDDDQTLQLISKELEEYDQTFQQLSDELKASPNDERVISAMIKYYQTKLEIINRILTELESKNLKSNNHEYTNI